MKVSAVLGGKPDMYGRKRVYITIFKDNQRDYIPTDYRIDPKNFNKGIITGPNGKNLTEQIRLKVIKTEMELLENVEKIVRPDPTFIEFAHDMLKKWGRRNKSTTTDKDMSEVNKITAYAGPKFRIQDFDLKFMEGFLEYCYSIDNCENTAWRSFKFIRKLTLPAIKEGILEKDPFDGFNRPKYTAPRRDWLTDDEMARIEKIARNPKASEGIRLVATWFLIGCYTALRYSDWHQFNKKKHIIEDRLILHTTKTGEVVSMPLVDKTKELFEMFHYKQMHHENQTVNSYLKDIAKTARIDKPLTAHISRHTFGVRAAHVMSIESCARLMGISVKVCAVYYKIIDAVSDKEYQKLFKDKN